MTVRRVLIGALLATGAALIAVFGFFYFRDNFFTHYPVKTISARVFRAGQIPWWNYYEGGGQVTRLEAVIDTNFGRPRIVYVRDLTELGKGFDLTQGQ